MIESVRDSQLEERKTRAGKGVDIWGCFLSSPPSISLFLSLSERETGALRRESRFSLKPPKRPRDVVLYVEYVNKAEKERHNERAGSQRENAAASGSESRTDNALPSLQVKQTSAGLLLNININALSLLFRPPRVSVL